MNELSKKILIFLTVLATLLILFANFYLWLNRYIFNPQNFKEISTNAILSDESRQAISAEVVDAAIGDKPLIKEVVGQRLESVITALLDSSVSQTLVEKLSLDLQKHITSPEKKDISINLAAVKSIVKPLTEAISPGQPTTIETNQIPDNIILARKNTIPSIYSWGKTVLWLGPISFIAGVSLFIYMIFRTDEKSWLLKISGISLVIGSVISIIIPYLFMPALFASISNANAKLVLENIFLGFAAKMTQQSLILLNIGFVFIIVGYFVRFPVFKTKNE